MFKDWLKQTMKEQGITQTELSELTGVSKGSVSYYLSGKVDPPDNTKKRIADALNATLYEVKAEPLILGDKREKNITPEQAAKLLGQSKDTIRYALQQGTSPFGYACKGTGSKWVYHISPKKLNEYIGG